MIDYGLKNRGVEDILIACVDGLNGFPQAIEAVYPKTEIQQCIIHQIRNSTKFVSYKDIKKLMADLKLVYAAPTEETALNELELFKDKWDSKYPKLISELKQSVELLKNSNELLQDAISGEIGSLKDEVKENTVQEVRKALQANIEAIQRATKLLEKQSDTLTSVMKQKLRELEESKNSFFRYEGLKLYLFWGGMVCNILVFLMLASSMFGR